MSEEKQPLYQLGDYDRAVQVMVYTNTGLLWGEVIVKQAIRASIWLRLNTAPDNLCFYNARFLTTTAGGAPKPMSLPEAHIPTSQVLAYHMVPPAVDLPELDAKEVNLRMEPVTALAGTARIDGFLRFTGRINLGSFIDISKEPFTGIFDAEISHPVMPALGLMRVPHLLVRQSTTTFATRQV